MTDTKRPRGRPRPQATMDRDAKLLRYLKDHGPQTRNALAENLGLTKTLTYLALDRLRRDGLVQVCPGQGGPDMKWSPVSEGVPCP